MALLGSPPVFSNTYTLEHTPLLAHERQAAAGRAVSVFILYPDN